MKSSLESISALGGEGVCTGAAEGADPVFGEGVKGGSGAYTAVVIAGGGIVNITA
jgi:hypothetical protein